MTSQSGLSLPTVFTDSLPGSTATVSGLHSAEKDLGKHRKKRITSSRTTRRSIEIEFARFCPANARIPLTLRKLSIAEECSANASKCDTSNFTAVSIGVSLDQDYIWHGLKRVVQLAFFFYNFEEELFTPTSVVTNALQ